MTRFLKKQTTRTLILLSALLLLPAMAFSGRGSEVGINKSVMVDLKNPVQRCESADPAIAGCVMILSTQLQITGVAPGKTKLTLVDDKGKKQPYAITVKELREIPLHKNITIDLRRPIKTWSVKNPAIVKCARISPNRLQIIGLSVGETSVTILEKKRDKQTIDIAVTGGTEVTRTQGKTTPLSPTVVKKPETILPIQSALKTDPAVAKRSRTEASPPSVTALNVALHQSLKKELTKASLRCESADPSIVECLRISPTLLQISGASIGNASLTLWEEDGGKQIYNVHVKGHKEIVLPRSIIELPKPVQRCESATPSTLECIRISPTQLQLNGTTLGKSSIAVWEEDGGKQIFDIDVKGMEIPLNKIQVVKFEIPSHETRHAAANSLTQGKEQTDGEKTLRITPIMADKEIANFIKSTDMPVSSQMSNGHYQANLLIRGVKIGETSLIIMDGDGSSQSYDIRVRPDLSRLEQKIREAAPHDQITVEYANDTLVLSGKATNDQTITKIELLAKAYATKHEADATKTADNTIVVQHGIPREVYKIINLIQIDNPQQVLLEVKVAQVDKSALKSLGVSAFVKGSSGEGFSNLIGVPTGTGISGTGTALGSIGTLDPFQLGFSLFKPGIGAVLKALVTKNQAKILAEPNLLVRSGEDGNFLAGSKIPYTVIQSSNGTSNTTVIWQDVGVKLKFRPEVLENGLINLKIDPAEVSSISGVLPVNGYPIIDSREVRTSVQLKEGESLILAGLLQEEAIKTMSKIPLMGDIPILGALFRSTQEDIKEKELVFFITPRLVKPTAQGVKTPLPTDKQLTPEQKEDMGWMPRK
jgi:pilus assembly protein CpaC